VFRGSIFGSPIRAVRISRTANCLWDGAAAGRLRYRGRTGPGRPAPAEAGGTRPTAPPPAISGDSWRALLPVGDELQDVPRLAVQRGADGLQGGEAHRLGLVVLQDGQVGQGDVHFLRELGEGH